MSLYVEIHIHVSHIDLHQVAIAIYINIQVVRFVSPIQVSVNSGSLFSAAGHDGYYRHIFYI